MEGGDDVVVVTGPSPQCGPASTGNTTSRRLQSGGSSGTTQRIILRVLNTPEQPFWVQVQGITDVSRPAETGGPMSDAQGPVMALCDRDEYLATQFAARGQWSQAVCLPCPEGGVCGGQAWEDMTNQEGYYRVAWSPDGLLFERCDIDAACPTGAAGFDDPTAPEDLPEGAFSGGSASAITHTCAPGYDGPLCGNCEFGFAPQVDGLCAVCGPIHLVRFAFAGGFITAVLMISFLIRTALRSRGTATKPHVALAKLLLVHLQQVALASAFPMEWPASLETMFALFDASSNVGEALLSIDCLGYRITSTFLGNRITQLLLPFVAVALVGGVWALVAAYRVLAWYGGAARPHDPLQDVLGYMPKEAAELAQHTQDTVTMARIAEGISPADEKEETVLAGMAANPLFHTARDKAKIAAMKDRKEAPAPVVVPPASQPLRLHGVSLNPMVETVDSKAGPVVNTTRTAITSRARSNRLSAVRLKDAKRKRTPQHHVVGALMDSKPVVLTPVQCFIVSVIVIAFVFQLSLAKAALSLFTCETVSGRSMLAGDLQFDCSDPANHGFMFGVGLPALVFYGFGISFATGAVLYAHREQLQEPVTRAVLGFLFSSYRDERYYWEMVVQMRKVGLAFVGVLLRPSGIGVQTTAGTTLMVLASLVHNAALPFRSHILNHFENASIVVTMVTLNGGSTLIDPDSTLAAKGFVTVLIFVMNIAFVCAVSFALFRLLCGDLSTQVTVRRAFRRIGARRRGEIETEVGLSAQSDTG